MGGISWMVEKWNRMRDGHSITRSMGIMTLMRLLFRNRRLHLVAIVARYVSGGSTHRERNAGIHDER